LDSTPVWTTVDVRTAIQHWSVQSLVGVQDNVRKQEHFIIPNVIQKAKSTKFNVVLYYYFEALRSTSKSGD
jgi:hypothetical protein